MSILGTPTRLFDRHGVDATYTQISSGSFDITTNEFTGASTTNTVVKVYPSKNRFSDTQSPNLVGKIIRTYLISGETIVFTPAKGDKITVGSEVLEVHEVIPHYALGAVSVWRLISVSS